MKQEHTKWVFSFVLLFLTVGWAIFTVMIVRGAAVSPTSMSVLEASGTSVLLGALIGWNTLVVQYWFRKKLPE